MRAAYDALFDRASEGRGSAGEAWRIATGDTPLRLLTPAGFSKEYDALSISARRLPCFAALHFRVRSTAQTASVLQQSGVDYTRRADGSLAVASALTHGLLIVFTENAA